MIQAKTMLPQAACACKCACNSACECVLELVAGRVCVCVAWEDDCFGQLDCGSFRSSRSMGSFIQPEVICILSHIGTQSVFVVLCSRMCGDREGTIAVRFNESDRFRLSRA